MIMRNWWAILLVACLSSTGCSSCTDGTGNNDNSRVEPETEVPDGARLEHTGTCVGAPICALDVSFSTEAPLRVQLVGPDGTPIDNTAITFDLNDSGATGSSLSSAQGVTDSGGIAEVSLRSNTSAGLVEVTVSAGGEGSSVSPIQFKVSINAKDASSYRISFNHQGAADLRDIVVRAFPGNTTCDEIRADHDRETTPGQNPMLTAVTQGMGTAAADGNLPLVVIPNVPNGTAYSFEARGKSRANPEVEASFGCKDGNPAIENGSSVDVTIDLIDNLPQIAGSYDVTHTFSIQDVLCDPNGGASVIPDGVCTAIDLIGKLATNPAAFFVGDMDGDGVLQILFDFLPDGSLKDTINGFLDNAFIQGLAADVLNDFFAEWLDENAPSWLSGAVNITGDIYNTLQEFQVVGTIRIDREPTVMFDETSGNVVGLLSEIEDEKPGKQIWTDVIVFWTGDCAVGDDACRKRQFSANDLNSGTVVEGDFTASVVPVQSEISSYALVIDQHTLQLNLGVLVLGILEQVILPSVFGDPGINSIDKALGALLSSIFNGNSGCEGFGDFIEAQVGGGGGVATTVCNSLLTRASDALEDLLIDNLSVGGADNFLMSTNAEEPCELIEPSAYAGDWSGKPLPYAESLGAKEPAEMQCQWDLRLMIGGGSPIQADATFWGTRAGFITE